MIDLGQFREYVIDPVLEEMSMYSVAASELLLGTAIQESRLTYLVQLGGGPALGVFQMEPATFRDIWTNYLAYRPSISKSVQSIAGVTAAEHATAKQMVWHLAFAAAMCRVHYRRVAEAMPPAGDRPAQAAYWKEYYNTPLGAGTEAEYLENWENAHGH